MVLTNYASRKEERNIKFSVFLENAITSKAGEEKANGDFKAERADLAALLFVF